MNFNKIFILFFYFLLILFSCKKNKNTPTTTLPAISSVTQYVNQQYIYVYANEGDIGKPIKEIKDKNSYLYLEFGNKVNILEYKKNNNIEIYKIQLPDNSVYWGEKRFFSEKFITIIQTDVITSRQPDPDFVTSIKLQPGDFGIFVKEMKGWINVDFYAYRPYSIKGEKKWVGNLWIKDGYTDNLKTAKQAYYLYWAYYYLIQKNNRKEAINMCQKALEFAINEGDTEITHVIKKQLDELEGKKDNNIENSNDINQ